MPTVNDPGLAPPGKHVLSAIVQYAPYALKDGWLRSSGSASLDLCIGIARAATRPASRGIRAAPSC